MNDGVEPAELVGIGYDAVAQEYAALEGDVEWPRMRWVARALSGSRHGSDVLDLGCGNGVPATREIARDHNVVGVDVSMRQIELARQNVPGARFVHSDALALSFAPSSFDAVVALYTFDHVPREHHATLYERIHTWLRPGGVFLLSVEPEAQDGSVHRWLGVEMFFSSYDADATQELIRAAGFTIDATSVEEQFEGTKVVPFLWILARR